MLKALSKQWITGFFCTQDAISESFHLLLRLFIFNANISNSKTVHTRTHTYTHTLQEVWERVCPQGSRVGVSRDVKLLLSSVTRENQFSGPHGNIQWQSLSGAVLRSASKPGFLHLSKSHASVWLLWAVWLHLTALTSGIHVPLLSLFFFPSRLPFLPVLSASETFHPPAELQHSQPLNTLQHIPTQTRVGRVLDDHSPSACDISRLISFS